jgi:hypothetical protein
LLRNTADANNHWLTVQLQGTRSNRAGLGARVAVLRAGKPPLWRRAHSDGSYLSANDPRVHFGMGAETGVQAVGVVWPNGARELWRDIASDGFITLKEGSGTAWDAKP